MKENKTVKGRIRALFLLALTLIFIFTLASCESGSDEIYTKDELRENVSGEDYAGYDYVWKYFNRWNFPKFDSSKVKNVEYLLKRSYYKELPSTVEHAKAAANYFLDNYYDKTELTDTKAVTDAILKSYTETLGDKWAEYRTPEEYNAFSSSSSGTIVGIGVTVTKGDNGEIVVVSPMQGSPAEVAGILSDDVIVAIDGTRVENMEFTKATALITGEVGTAVSITVLRDGKEITLHAVRAMIDEQTVSYSINDGIGYIRISGFKLNTDEQFKAAIDHMKENGVNSVIYDLRQNFGGYLSTVIEMLEYLAPKGITLASFSDSTEPMVDESEDSYLPTAVILTDYNTASAAELFTAAVLDLSDMGYGKAVSVGVTTRGKGVMQSTFSLGDGSAITFTSAYYNSPSGQNFHDKGIVPDFEVLLDGVYDTQYERALIELKNLKDAA